MARRKGEEEEEGEKFKTSLNCRLPDSHGFGIRNEDVECILLSPSLWCPFWFVHKKHGIAKYHRSEFLCAS